MSLYFILTFRRKRRLLDRFGDSVVMEKLTIGIRWGVLRAKPILMMSVILFLVITLARPQFGIKEEKIKRKGVDIMVALDTSLSMAARDIQPSRLLKAKNEISHLIDMLQGDRIGLVAFAGDSFVQCPLTLDYGAAKLFLDIMDPGIIPTPGTSISGAIKTASDAFSKKEQKYKVLILLTDGEEHEGEAIKVAQDAAEEGIRIYAVGMGNPKGEPIPMLNEKGKKEGYKKDSQGNVVMSQLDESTLQKITLMTGGKYYRATPDETELETIYQDIRKMEQKELASKQFTRYEERYQVFLLVAIMILIVEALLVDRKKDSGEIRCA
jgi:Ca-activated chloride channel family protein